MVRWCVCWLMFLMLNAPAALAKDLTNKPPHSSITLSGYDDEDAVKQRLGEMDLQPIEGVWFYPNERLTVAVERMPKNGNVHADYRMVVLTADDAVLLPGTIVGYMTRSANESKYEMWIYSEYSDEGLENPRKCVATMDSVQERLTFTREEWKLWFRVNVARFLPTLFKGVSFIPQKEKEQVPEGFVKIYPKDDDSQSGEDRVRYL